MCIGVRNRDEDPEWRKHAARTAFAVGHVGVNEMLRRSLFGMSGRLRFVAEDLHKKRNDSGPVGISLVARGRTMPKPNVRGYETVPPVPEIP